jgi:hypothetical protein
MILGLLLSTCLTVLACFATACGEEGAEAQAQIDAYVASFLAAQEDATTALAYVPPALFDDDDVITDAERESIEANYAGNNQTSRGFLDTLAAGTPPASIEDEHTAFVSALEAQLQYRERFTSRYGQVETVEQLQELTAEVLDSDEGQQTQAAVAAACRDLRDATAGSPTPIPCGDE